MEDATTSGKIAAAIRRRQVVQFVYHGYLRVVEPHVLGWRRGVQQVLGFQIAGQSSSGRLPDWRRFDITAMSDVLTLPEIFTGPRPDMTDRQSTFDSVTAIVDTAGRMRSV